MRKAFRVSATLALAAMLGTAATPAMADRGWYGGGHGGWGNGYHHHDRDDGFGTFLGVAAIIGAVAIIASSADKNAKAAHARDSEAPRDQPYEDARAGSEDAAVDDCAIAARDEGSRDGYYAEVRDITGTRAIDGGWDVDGTIDQREGYRGEGRTRRFSCTWRDGRVAEVILSRDSIALR